MIIETLTLGTVEINEQQCIRFAQGVPGFEHLHDFALIDLQGDMPLQQLQSVEEPAISFLVGDPFYFYPDYAWDVPEAVQTELKITEEVELKVVCIITIPSDVSASTINLLAPILINSSERLGKQLILHTERYKPRQPLFAVDQAGRGGI